MLKAIENGVLTVFTGLLLRKVAREVQTDDPAGKRALALIGGEGTRQIRNYFSMDHFLSAADKAFDKLSS